MYRSLLAVFLLVSCQLTMAQLSKAERIQQRMPEGTVVHGNIPYHDDTLHKHLLDVYLPAHAEGKVPVVVFVHGGGWITNDKYADMGYMPQTIAAMPDNGLAVVSIDYRFAMDAVFPAIVQDCNMAVTFLYDNADTYGLDRDNIALMGFSAGGHLASLMGTSQNNEVKNLHVVGSYRSFRYKAVVDYYGPMNLLMFPGNDDPTSPEAILIGATPLDRPDLAHAASPLTYIDAEDPPCFIIHGEKDDMVSSKQSKLFSAWLNIHGVDHELIIVEGAPHYGTMFDVEEIREPVISFLTEHLK